MSQKKEGLGRGKMILQFLQGIKRFFFLSIFASILSTVFNFLTPQVIRITVDSVIGNEPFKLPAFLLEYINTVGGREALRGNLLLCAGFILVFALLSGLCTYICRVATAKGSEGFVLNMREGLFAHIQRLPYAWHVKNQTGDIIQRCTSDVDVVRNFVANQMLEVVRTVFLITLALSIMFSMNVKMSLVALAFIPVVILYSGIFYYKISRKFRAADEAEGDLTAAVQENFTGVRVVRAFGREKYEIDRFRKKNNKFSNLWIKLGHLLGYYWGIGDLFTGLQILTIILLGTVEAVNGSITVGEFLAFVSYNSTLVWPIRNLGRILSEMSKASVSIDRVNYILKEEEEADEPEAIDCDLHGDIEFSNINFSYEGEKPILQDINFTVKAGSTFGILGGTGCGKSTLMHLLDRLYDLPAEAGEIRIGGVNINHIKRDCLRRNIGMVLQEPFLFSKTIKENIGVADPGAKFEEIRSMTSIACVDDAIEQFSEGYDTVVGERGVTLSGGQKQRVAIARMLMQKAPIMVFDDSLSAVDSETDAKIREQLNTNLKESTVILISHRITTLMHADEILVMENGRIVEQGTHNELIAKEGVYKNIYDIQMNSEDKNLTKEAAEHERV